MKAAVFRILILRLAGAAHGEGGHGGGRAIVGYVADDGVARTAVGAIGEGISVAPVRRVPKIAPAGVAGAGVRGNQREFASLLPAIKDREARAPLNAISETVIWAISASCGGSSFSVLRNSSTCDPPPSISIVTPEDELKTYPVRAQRPGQLVHERTKPHSLHDASHLDVLASVFRCFQASFREAAHPPHHTWTEDGPLGRKHFQERSAELQIHPLSRHGFSRAVKLHQEVGLKSPPEDERNTRYGAPIYLVFGVSLVLRQTLFFRPDQRLHSCPPWAACCCGC